MGTLAAIGVTLVFVFVIYKAYQSYKKPKQVYKGENKYDDGSPTTDEVNEQIRENYEKSLED